MNILIEMEFIDWLEQEAKQLAEQAKILSKEPPTKENNTLMSEYTGKMSAYAQIIEKFLVLKEQDIASQN